MDERKKKDIEKNDSPLVPGQQERETGREEDFEASKRARAHHDQRWAHQVGREPTNRSDEEEN